MVLKNHIEEYFLDRKETSEERVSRELFKGDKENIDLKTDLSIIEISQINTMILNDDVLKSCGLEPSFSMFYNEYLRLKISLDRKSRTEFVQINKRDNTEGMVDGLKTAGSLFGVQK